MTTIHAGDRTSNCTECAANDYLNEIITEENLDPNIYESALTSWVANAPDYYKWEDWQEWYPDFAESFQGWYEQTTDFTEQLAEDCFLYELTTDSPLRLYFDYQKWDRDCFMGDYWESDGNIFRSI